MGPGKGGEKGRRHWGLSALSRRHETLTQPMSYWRFTQGLLSNGPGAKRNRGRQSGPFRATQVNQRQEHPNAQPRHVATDSAQDLWARAGAE